MHALHEQQLLSKLPRVELAKLVSDITTVRISRGDEIPLADEQGSYVYLVHTGKIGVFVGMGDAQVTLTVLGAGEVVGEGVEEPAPGTQFCYRVIEDGSLYRLTRVRFNQVLAQHPEVMRQFTEGMIRRSTMIMDELARAKSALLMHATEVWAMMEEATSTMHDVVLEPEPAPAPLPPLPVHSHSVAHPSVWPWHLLMAHGMPVFAALLVYFLGNFHLAFDPLRASLAILVWGVLAWLVDALPDWVVALAIGLVATVVGIVQPEIAFSGFSSKTWFLLLAVLGISAGISHTGLLYRVALHMLKLFPASYSGQSVAMAIGGFLIAPFLPGVTGRQALASRLGFELSEAMGFRSRSKGAVGLAMACFLGFSCIYFGSMTGGSVTLMVWSVLPAAAKASVSWGSWLLAAMPASLVVFVATLLTVIRMYRPENNAQLSSSVVESQLRVLGPMSRQEWITVWVVLAVVLAFATQPMHGFDPTWIALPGFLLLAATGIIDKNVLRKGIDWGFLLLTGGLLGIVALTSDTGFSKLIGGTIVPLIQPLAGSPWLFFSGVAILTSVIHLAVPFQPTILLTAITLIPVAGKLGYNQFLVGLVILIMSSHFIIPAGNPMYLAAYGGAEQCFTHKQVRKLSLIHAAITLIGIWVSIPIWRLMRLV